MTQHCTCTFGPDPGCAVDHVAEQDRRQSDIAERAAEMQRDPDWLSSASADPLLKPDMWRLFLDGDDIAFCARLRKEMAAQALSEATHEIDQMRRLAA